LNQTKGKKKKMGWIFDKFFEGKSKALEEEKQKALGDYYSEQRRKEEERRRKEEERRRREEEAKEWEYNKKIDQAISLGNAWGETPEEREERKKKNDWFSSGW
jgi:hypothetical protein